MMTVIVLGRSLTKALEILPARVASLLNRNGYLELDPRFELDQKPEIYATNSRHILANMNQMRFNTEYQLTLSEVLDDTDIEVLEDQCLDQIIGGRIAENNRFIRPVDQLKELSQHY